jgi:S-adenosylmethionine synthetase
MKRVHIEAMSGPSVAEMETEIVERKGLGHPDTICDAVMESISQALCRAYASQFGRVLHYNCDKALLVAGQVERCWGGGRVTSPMRMVIGDRATSQVGDASLDIPSLVVETAHKWFRRHLRHVDPERHLTYQVEIRPGSQELVGLFQDGQRVLGANDTSAVVGYAPLTETERIVLETERYVNSPALKASFPETGEDVKVMAVREHRTLSLIIAMPLLDRYLSGERAYFQRKEEVRQAALGYVQSNLKDIQEVTVALNLLDQPGMDLAGTYVSVLGTSAEDADSGQVGRGNEINGLICLNRPRGSEAASGKNPVSHVGKIYNVLAHRLANRLYEELPPVKETIVWLCSRIGEPIDQPFLSSVQVRLEPGTTLNEVSGAIRDEIEREFEGMEAFCRELAEGKFSAS